MKLPSGVFKMTPFLAVIRRGSVRPCCGSCVAKSISQFIFKYLAYVTFKEGLAALDFVTENEAKLF